MSVQDQAQTASEKSELSKAEDKGKAAAAPVDQQEDESDSEMEEDDSKVLEEEDAGEESEDDMGEIDTSNIIESGRTRGKRIDYTKEVANVPEVDDEDDDDDFVEPANTEA